MIKLIAVDLDGTLLKSDGSISLENKAALNRAKELGIKVVICTGRPLLSVAAILDEMNLREPGDYVITYNGGLVQRADTGEILSEKSLTKEEAIELYELSKSLDLPCNLLDLDNIYELPYPKGRESWYPRTKPALPFVPTTLEELPEDSRFNKIIFCYDENVLNEEIKGIPAEFYQKFTIMKSRPILIEMMNKEVDKGEGIAVLCDLLDFQADEVMAFGDEANDHAMIEFAGMGVAMGNATPALKNIAQYITDTNDNHGIAQAIEKFVLIKTEHSE
ncbi:HAD family phosphatase [Desemzia sp. RIT804]|uniref:Cof-type HAD-IIB family hydrolase n=1 Tax=Desemzia sp. RIT 804 TaxID=2810209 RepID=UPI001950FFE9|nr:Cof-type HAD-IIB family hydrolase [Desemzia sp. RIT 804]MBM6613679.1 HAD family phosphatase [Desemzia sp. RIT 804]